MFSNIIFICGILAETWASCQIYNIAGCAYTGNAGNVFPATAGQRSRHASRHVRDARVLMHVGIASCRFPLKLVAGKTVPAFPAHAQLAIWRIWYEAHYMALWHFAFVVASGVFYHRNDTISKLWEWFNDEIRFYLCKFNCTIINLHPVKSFNH